MAKVFVTESEDKTIALGEDLARRLKHGDLVALFGDLGTGKTRFVQGVCRGLGIREHVASPTFTIVNQYNAGELVVYHFDFYRVNSLSEIRDVGFEDYVAGDGISLIEWAEKVHQLLPSHRYDVRLELGETENTRKITIEEIAEVIA